MTFLIVVPALLPLYVKLGMDRRLLACAAAMNGEWYRYRMCLRFV